MKKKFAALTICVLISGAASAQSLVDGSAEAGKAKAIICGACHGADGNSVNPVWPSIAGQHPTYIVNQLRAFKDGTRTEPLMLGQAMLLLDEDMRNLAVYFSEMTTATKVIADPSTLDYGERLYRGGSREDKTPACIACHGPTGTGNTALGAPNLTDDIWLYGGPLTRISQSIAKGRNGQMPAHGEFLGEAKIHLLTAYVYGLSQEK